jgi:hypothetical protein
MRGARRDQQRIRAQVGVPVTRSAQLLLGTWAAVPWLLLLYACVATPPPGPVAPAPCGDPAPAPAALPALVTPETLRAHDAAERAARLATEAVLAACAAR